MSCNLDYVLIVIKGIATTDRPPLRIIHFAGQYVH